MSEVWEVWEVWADGAQWRLLLDALGMYAMLTAVSAWSVGAMLRTRGVEVEWPRGSRRE